MRILGIDPGLRRTGFGVIDVHGARLSYVTSGTIVVPADQPLASRLKIILDNVREVVQSARPTVSAMGQARGAALCALADSLLDVHEYTALQIKKSVVGNGHAAKEQVQMMVQHLLALSGAPAPDSADALACAICHAHFSPLSDRLQRTGQLAASRGRVRGGRLIG
jgi:crossover junction endodeoxyribonuclease RuvC